MKNKSVKDLNSADFLKTCPNCKSLLNNTNFQVLIDGLFCSKCKQMLFKRNNLSDYDATT